MRQHKKKHRVCKDNQKEKENTIQSHSERDSNRSLKISQKGII